MSDERTRPEPPGDLQRGDVIQISQPPEWGVCLAIVDQPKPWGCTCYLGQPGPPGGAPTWAFLQVRNGDFGRTGGRALFIPDVPGGAPH